MMSADFLIADPNDLDLAPESEIINPKSLWCKRSMTLCEGVGSGANPGRDTRIQRLGS
tara:strand:- start:194 stop:367 length:174 start_codon:yes stop_codon:yes gene_type:complete